MFIVIDPIMIKPNFAWDGLVFIKPENLSKTELVEKFKNLSSSKSLKDLKDKKDNIKEKITIKDFLKSYYSKTSAFIFKFKNLITKIALFAILIRYFRKFKLLRFIFKIINYILLSTLGIFISDIYGLKEIIAEIEYCWMNYVNFIHESKIYKSLIKIFHVIIDEDKSEIIKDKSKIVENKETYDFPSSNREFENEKIIHDKISERNTRENRIELKTYFLIGISIISLGLIYVYWDSINELFKNIKPDSDGNESNITETPKFLDPQEEYEKYFKEKSTNEELYDLEIIRNQSKGKIIDYSDVEKTNWEDSPITPKASQSKLPESRGVMLPISKK